MHEEDWINDVGWDMATASIMRMASIDYSTDRIAWDRRRMPPTPLASHKKERDHGFYSKTSNHFQSPNGSDRAKYSSPILGFSCSGISVNTLKSLGGEESSWMGRWIWVDPEFRRGTCRGRALRVEVRVRYRRGALFVPKHARIRDAGLSLIASSRITAGSACVFAVTDLARPHGVSLDHAGAVLLPFDLAISA